MGDAKNRRLLTVAIPVKDEAAHIGPCLEALNAQVGVRLDHIVLLLNNCSDGSALIARSVPLHAATRLHILERQLPPAQANAGHARRFAMDAALELAGPNGIIMTTDADGQVDFDWAAATLSLIQGGVEVVAGWAELDPLDWGKIPLRLHEDDARECAYDAVCDEIDARLDPTSWDPWPRHAQHSGASIAVTASAYRRCGGVPDRVSGEDRALIAALRSVDARVRHALEVHVTVSGRTVGRAAGGMAETIRRRLETPDPYLDTRLEAAAVCALRAQARAAFRRLFAGTDIDARPLSALLQIPTPTLIHQLSTRYFGEAWNRLERLSTKLTRVPVAVDDLSVEMTVATDILVHLETLAQSEPRAVASVSL